MKVCFILSSYYPLNPAPYEYSQVIAQKGWKVDVIARGRDGDQLVEQLGDVNVIRLIPRKHQSSTWYSGFEYNRLVLKQLSDERYDIAHVYAFRGAGLLPFLGRKNASKWLMDIRTGNVSRNAKRSNLANKMTRLESLSFDACAAIDNEVGVKVLGPKRKFHVFPIGVDLDKFNPRAEKFSKPELGMRQDRLCVVYSGKLEPQRSLDKILYAFEIASHSCSDLDLLIVGGGSYLPKLQSIAEQIRIDNKVFFTNIVPYEDVQRFILVGDIGLAYVPVTDQFDFQPPLKTLEFLACGLSSIATRTYGNQKYINDGMNGLLVEDTVEDVARGLIRLGNDSELRRKLAEAARPSIINRDWQSIVAEKLLPVYTQLLG